MVGSAAKRIDVTPTTGLHRLKLPLRSHVVADVMSPRGTAEFGREVARREAAGCSLSEVNRMHQYFVECAHVGMADADVAYGEELLKIIRELEKAMPQGGTSP
jgi:hypothetical protein